MVVVVLVAKKHDFVVSESAHALLCALVITHKSTIMLYNYSDFNS